MRRAVLMLWHELHLALLRERGGASGRGAQLGDGGLHQGSLGRRHVLQERSLQHLQVALLLLEVFELLLHSRSTLPCCGCTGRHRGWLRGRGGCRRGGCSLRQAHRVLASEIPLRLKEARGLCHWIVDLVGRHLGHGQPPGVLLLLEHRPLPLKRLLLLRPLPLQIQLPLLGLLLPCLLLLLLLLRELLLLEGDALFLLLSQQLRAFLLLRLLPLHLTLQLPLLLQERLLLLLQPLRRLLQPLWARVLVDVVQGGPGSSGRGSPGRGAGRSERQHAG
mmetsp:Transcript_100415/g.312915  ORF Transcript_100415/g.312915 Transcript_100415/m.312915 type:complete len:277 (+) Transcript_100415:910-1740(+)